MRSDSHPDTPAILALLYAATMWGIFWYPLRLLDMQGMNGLWATAVSFAAATLFGLLFLRKYIAEWLLSPWPLFFMAVTAGWANLAFILAILDGTIVRAMLLFYLSPVWSVLLGWIFLHEHLSGRSIRVLSMAMIGALIMLWDPQTGNPLPSSSADWLALSAGLAFSISNTWIRRLQHISVTAKTSAAWAGAWLVAGAGIVLLADPVPVTNNLVWLAAIAIGVIGLTTMTLAVQYGVTRLPLHQSAVILLFELVAGSVSSYLLANERLTPAEMIGGALIMLAAWLIAQAPAAQTVKDTSR